MRKPYNCDICGRRFTQKVALQKHVNEQHLRKFSDIVQYFQQNRLTNLNNSKTFFLNTLTDLILHTLVSCTDSLTSSIIEDLESTKKLYSCAECGQKFSSLGSLSRHMSMHSGKYTLLKCFIRIASSFRTPFISAFSAIAVERF